MRPRSGGYASGGPVRTSHAGGRPAQGGFRGGRPSSGRPAQSRGGSRFKGVRIDVSKFINKARIVEETPAYVPEHAFADFAIDPRLKKTVAERGYITPTPIQDRAIPHVLLGEDVIGIANTGTGKTAAFLLPLIHKVLGNPTERVIIVVPTRELAIQIHDELRAVVKGLSIFAVTCIGGAGIGEQLRNLKNRHNFVIGTPGRLKDLIERKALDMSKFSTIVLDEADRMLDMGFIPDMKFIMGKMPAKRHSLFFSATFSPEIEKLVQGFLKNPVKISVKTGDTAENVDQDIVRIIDRTKKMEVLHDLLNKTGFAKVLIFGQTKHGVEKLSKELEKRGFKSASIHGNKNQSQRKKALSLFKSDMVHILVATDVAARGLDIDNVSHVINYDLPATYEDYTHRIGRTGRAGKKGSAITFVE
jgi:superfamily II DNA/RNA helicase